MTKETLVDLFKTYQEAENKYQQYLEQFFTYTINNTVIQQAAKGMGPEDDQIIQKLRDNANEEKKRYEEAYKEWRNGL